MLHTTSSQNLKNLLTGGGFCLGKKVIPEDTSSFEVDGLAIHALPVLHGADYDSRG